MIRMVSITMRMMLIKMAAPHYVPCSHHKLVTIIFVMRVYDINIRLAFFQAFTDTAGSANSVGTDSKEVETATRLRQSSLNSPEHQIIIIIVITIIRQSSLNLTNIIIIIITNVIIIIKSSSNHDAGAEAGVWLSLI